MKRQPEGLAGSILTHRRFTRATHDGIMLTEPVRGGCVRRLGRRHHTRSASVQRLESKIRAIPGFPRPGVVFRDITPLVGDPAMLRFAVDQLIHPFIDEHINAVAGMEARGFIFGALAAQELNVGFVPLRKPGKLPYNVQSVSYDMEYGTTSLEAHIDAVAPGDRILLVDDLIATGGTASASCELVERLGGEIVACTFVMELDGLEGRAKLPGRRVHSLLHY